MSKPRLADGSHWDERHTAVRNGPVEVYVDSDGMLRVMCRGETIGCEPLDALAVIDAAGLDPVRVAARHLLACLARDGHNVYLSEESLAAVERLGEELG